jgi:hypothetical protein
MSTTYSTSLPIFVHSLFRSSSTYWFHAFRRSEAGYYCYQEPLHEYALAAQSDPNKLLFRSERDFLANHHPLLDRGYLAELHGVWPHVGHLLTSDAIYADFFSQDTDQPSLVYWKALCEASHTKGRPVVHECRSWGRMGTIKRHLGGLHLYLVRNPWDQWWSHQVAPYFDVANQLILAASDAPAWIRLLQERVSLPRPQGGDVLAQMQSIAGLSLSAEQSFLIFYSFWCCALRQAFMHADIIIHVDALHDNNSAIDNLLQLLQASGVHGIDLSDFRLHSGWYHEFDRAFFIPLELEVRSFLAADDWTRQDFASLDSIRRDHETRLAGRISAKKGIEMALNQHERWRKAAIRDKNIAASFAQQLSSTKLQLELAQQKIAALEHGLAVQPTNHVSL